MLFLSQNTERFDLREIAQCYASAVKRISSRQNAIVAAFRAAARGDAGDMILLDGAHLVGEALAAAIPIRTALVLDASADPEVARLTTALERHGADIAVASASVMAAASPVKSSSPIVALAHRPEARRNVFGGHAPLTVIACDVQDPGNVGALVRVAEAAGASGVIVAGQSSDPFGWKALRGSMGSALRLPVVVMPHVADAVHAARASGARIVATAPHQGQSLFETTLTGPLALLIGGEGAGLSDAAIASADARVTIPMEAPVESLNAAVAAAVLLFEARRQRLTALVSR